MTTTFDRAVKRLESVDLPNVIYLDQGKDMVLDGDVKYRLDISTDHFDRAVARFEKAKP